jgi:hypothetical protein
MHSTEVSILAYAGYCIGESSFPFSPVSVVLGIYISRHAGFLINTKTYGTFLQHSCDM